MNQRNRVAWIVIALFVGLVSGNSALADRLRYLAWDGSHARGVIETEGHAREVSLGDQVPEFGTVVELDASHIVLRRVLSDAERANLERLGSIGHRDEKVGVVREDLRFHAIQSD